jgi:hypothetical protein
MKEEIERLYEQFVKSEYELAAVLGEAIAQIEQEVGLAELGISGTFICRRGNGLYECWIDPVSGTITERKQLTWTRSDNVLRELPSFWLIWRIADVIGGERIMEAKLVESGRKIPFPHIVAHDTRLEEGIVIYREGDSLIVSCWFPQSDDIPNSGFSVRVPLRELEKLVNGG